MGQALCGTRLLAKIHEGAGVVQSVGENLGAMLPGKEVSFKKFSGIISVQGEEIALVDPKSKEKCDLAWKEEIVAKYGVDKQKARQDLENGGRKGGGWSYS